VVVVELVVSFHSYCNWWWWFFRICFIFNCSGLYSNYWCWWCWWSTSQTGTSGSNSVFSTITSTGDGGGGGSDAPLAGQMVVQVVVVLVDC
jgi:hypothetical protein